MLRDPPDLRVFRFTRVVFGVSSSPFLLNATICFHLEKYLETNESLVRQLLHSTYIDDIISGGHTEDEVLTLCIESKRIFCEGGFNLRKFRTNSKHLQDWINLHKCANTHISSLQDEQTFSEITLGVSQPLKLEEHKVLGIPWSPESDHSTLMSPI